MSDFLLGGFIGAAAFFAGFYYQEVIAWFGSLFSDPDLLIEPSFELVFDEEAPGRKGHHVQFLSYGDVHIAERLKRLRVPITLATIETCTGSIVRVRAVEKRHIRHA